MNTQETFSHRAVLVSFSSQFWLNDVQLAARSWRISRSTKSVSQVWEKTFVLSDIKTWIQLTGGGKHPISVAEKTWVSQLYCRWVCMSVVLVSGDSQWFEKQWNSIPVNGNTALLGCLCLPTQTACEHFIPKDTREMTDLPNPAVSHHLSLWVETCQHWGSPRFCLMQIQRQFMSRSVAGHVAGWELLPEDVDELLSASLMSSTDGSGCSCSTWQDLAS